MKTILFTAILGIVFCLVSCDSDNNFPEGEKQTIKKESINGFIQKGPFINGSSIVIIELDKNLVQTGRTFSTQIISNNGRFEIKGIELVSPYVELKADGFYFNEVSGSVSSERLTLTCLADISDHSTVNVNVISTLEKSRVEYLVSQGLSFAEAKSKAQQEVLAIFEMEKTGIAESELLNITLAGDDNAILLAVSVILQGYRTVASLSELISNIGFDLREDGVLDNPELGSMLINDIKRMDLQKIRTNIQQKYSELGSQVAMPEFESKVSTFVSNTAFEFTYKIKYPESGIYGVNLLGLSDGEMIPTYRNYSLRALVPNDMSLRVVFTNTSIAYSGTNDQPIGLLRRYAISDEIASWVSNSNSIRKFVWDAKPGFGDADCKILFEGVGTGTFDIYENGSTIPVRSFSIAWGMTDEIAFAHPAEGKYGPNLLALPDNSVLERGKTYSVASVVPNLFAFMYRVNLVHTNGSGEVIYTEGSKVNWESSIYFERSKTLQFRCLNGNLTVDAEVQFYGEGELRLEEELLGVPDILMKKTFTWK